eukprot:CAMPEP_0117474072 /NCGR_PEP_ID=MMETSP0784-20121206/9098_1 /TAXON_ID=39447 /ORGANISM="" /LENGTH=331 /DNA_ID=CAMNT_0005268291 /DNA_START=190 /DNA_END=1187 /DNA_ORIENTATION=-
MAGRRGRVPATKELGVGLKAPVRQKGCRNLQPAWGKNRSSTWPARFRRGAPPNGPNSSKAALARHGDVVGLAQTTCGAQRAAFELQLGERRPPESCGSRVRVCLEQLATAEPSGFCILLDVEVISDNIAMLDDSPSHHRMHPRILGAAPINGCLADLEGLMARIDEAKNVFLSLKRRLKFHGGKAIASSSNNVKLQRLHASTILATGTTRTCRRKPRFRAGRPRNCKTCTHLSAAAPEMAGARSGRNQPSVPTSLQPSVPAALPHFLVPARSAAGDSRRKRFGGGEPDLDKEWVRRSLVQLSRQTPSGDSDGDASSILSAGCLLGLKKAAQ